MKLIVMSRQQAIVYKPNNTTCIIRITSELIFEPLLYKNLYNDILELQFGDISDKHPINDIGNHTCFNNCHYNSIVSFVNKNKDCNTLIIHCDAGQSRSPAVAIGVLDYILHDYEQTKHLLSTNKHFKPNSYITSFFTRQLYKE